MTSTRQGVDVPCRLEGGRWDGVIGFVDEPVPERIGVRACEGPPDCPLVWCRSGAHWTRVPAAGGEPYRLVDFEGVTALYRHEPMTVDAQHQETRELILG
ncbi:MAG: hypothetical protein ACRDM7_19530 [Thermoleophilaceae bacterium]